MLDRDVLNACVQVIKPVSVYRPCDACDGSFLSISTSCIVKNCDCAGSASDKIHIVRGLSFGQCQKHYQSQQFHFKFIIKTL